MSDTSFGGGVLGEIANPEQINLLDIYRKSAETANSIWSNRLAQSKQRAGEIYLRSLNPDGTQNQAALNQGLAAGGRGVALSAQDASQRGLTNASGEQDMLVKRAAFINEGLPGLLTLPDDKLHDGLIDMMNRGRAQGIGTPESNIQIMSTFSHEPAVLRQQLERARIAMLPPDQKAARLYGTRPEVNTGGDIRFPNVPSPASGEPAPVIPTTPTPAERNATQPTWNPKTRQFESTPRQDVAPMVDGQGMPVPGSAVPGLPSSGRPPPPGATATPPPPTNLAKPSPGTEEEMKGATEHAVAARDRANNYQANIYPVEGAITALQGADTGKGGETLNTIRGYLGDTPLKYLSSFLPATLSDQEKRTLYDEANKYTTGMAQAVPGATSDQRAATAAAANPSVHISNAAALAVSKSILAQKRMEQAGTLAFNKTGQPAANYDTFMNEWSTNQDPRGFMADRMSPPERAAMVEKMGGVGSAAYERFKASYLAGKEAKVIDASR